MSGPRALEIGTAIIGRQLPARQAVYAHFNSSCPVPTDGHEFIDSGIAIYFSAPASFTGEDIVELQGHGGPLTQDLLLKELINLGARQARAGEFSERAFLNDKIDLTQAEAIADLINSSTYQAAKGAMRSLQGEFSKKIHLLLSDLIQLRMYVEAAIDFPEEEIDYLADEKLHTRVANLQNRLEETIGQATQGAVLRDGFRLVLAGKPNVGKSSLLNALSGEQVAIVTDVPGTTRDALSKTINIDGLAVHITDTAGLRDSQDPVEKIGVARARQAIRQADHILYLIEAGQDNLMKEELDSDKTTIVFNKIDLLDSHSHLSGLKISATRGDGMEKLTQHIKKQAGYETNGENLYTARRRHLTALNNALDAVQRGFTLLKSHSAGELLAEELLHCQHFLNEITGEFSSDDLLGEIFAGFCIGK